MNFNKSTCTLLLAAAFLSVGCQSERTAAEGGRDSLELKDCANVVFCLQANTAGPSTRGVEDSYEYIQGVPAEYAVNKAQVYLFDAPTKLFVKSFALSGLKRIGTDASGNIVYESNRELVPQGTYDIFVVANTDRKINQTTEDAFLADIDKVTYARGQIDEIPDGIIMTNRAIDNAGTVLVKKEGDEDNVIHIVLERVMARLDIAKGSESFALVDDNSRQYATVTLNGFYIVNLAKQYYSFRHTAVLTTLEEPAWSLTEHFGDVNDVNGYVIDPYFFKKTIDASGFTNSDKYFEHYFGDYANPNAVSWTSFKPASAGVPQYNVSYCLENCTLASAQKNGYTTGVIFKARMDPYNSVYHLASGGNLQLVTNPSDYPEVLYYCNYKFYDSQEALAAGLGMASLTNLDMETYKVRTFEKTDEGYCCFYNYWIRHLDNYKETVMGVMEFAVVRNNLYKMLITNVSGLGNILPIVNPDTPDEGEANLHIVLNVKPWIVRDLTNIVL